MASDDIPQVIEAARCANLFNIGGQLQFVLPDGICELYWLEVDTFRTIPEALPWHEKVELAASDALMAFNTLCREKDFVSQGKEAFSDRLALYEKAGGTVADAMRFVWYVQAQPIP